MEIIGSIDRFDELAIEGWITVPGNPEDKLHLEVLLGEAPIGQCVANLFRDDLKAAGLANGECAYRFEMPAFVPKGEMARVRVRLANSVVFLDLKQQANSAQQAIAPERVGNGRETVSRFGGLWIDRYDWLDRLAEKCRAKELSEALSVAIFRFVRDGYVVIENAVPPDTIDRLNAEIEGVWRNPPNGILVETFEPDGKMRYVPPEMTLRGGATKLLDLYAYSASARQAIAAPKTVEFLSAIFGEKPKAFQGLTFWNGSQQAIHKDTAYVKIDSNPMHLAATWLALEDIKPGTGELEYYVGSHRAADYLFAGVSKWMEAHADEHDKFLQSLHDDAESYGHVKGTFIAKKGDVLVWHADLAHGGAPIRMKGQSRRSLVTHFTADSDEPFYRRSSRFNPLQTANCNFVSQYSDVPAASAGRKSAAADGL